MGERTVLLYGNSLVVSIIGATLHGRPGLHLLRMAAEPGAPAGRLPTPPDAAFDRAATPPDVAFDLAATPPDVIIFDLVATPLQAVLPLAQGRPAPLLIGLDMASDRTVVVSGGQHSVHSRSDLLRLIGNGCGGR